MAKWTIDKKLKNTKTTTGVHGLTNKLGEEVYHHHYEIKDLYKQIQDIDGVSKAYVDQQDTILNNKIDALEIPSIEGLATEEYVNTELAKKVDTTTYEADKVTLGEELTRIEDESKDRDTALGDEISRVETESVDRDTALEDEISRVETESVDRDTALQTQITNNTNSITGNTNSIQDINNVLEGNARREFIADAVLTNPTITEGTWTTINWAPTLEDFPGITYNGDGTFTVSVDITRLDFKVSGQASNTNANKTVSIRLWDTTTNTQYGVTQSETIIGSGKVVYENVIQNLPASIYRIEITSTVGAGSITFTQGRIYLITYGTGATVSSVFADGVNVGDVNWADKADLTYVDTELETKADKTSVDNIVDSVYIQGGKSSGNEIKPPTDRANPLIYDLTEPYSNFREIQIVGRSAGAINSFSMLRLTTESIRTDRYNSLITCGGNEGVSFSCVYYKFTADNKIEIWSNGDTRHLSVEGIGRL